MQAAWSTWIRSETVLEGADRADRPDQHPTMPLIQIRRGRHDLARSRDQFRFGETAPGAPTRMQRSDMAAITERDEISAALLNKR